MEIHYFQRYSGAENVATNNTLLLISRLYTYKAELFYSVINKLIGKEDQVEADKFGLSITQQNRKGDSIPDGVISQIGFNIVIETKLSDSFGDRQIESHINSMEDHANSALLTLAPVPLNSAKENKMKEFVKTRNNERKNPLSHIHITFAEMINLISAKLAERDYELQDVLEEYREYCSASGLLSNADRLMRAVAVGGTFDENMKFNLYYDPASRGYTQHKFMGLYKDKMIRAVGKIDKIVEVELIDNEVVLVGGSKGEKITDEQRVNIKDAIVAGFEKNSYELASGHKFFLVDKFYETCYQKTTSGGLMGKKFFDLNVIAPTLLSKKPIADDIDVEKLAEELSKLTW